MELRRRSRRQRSDAVAQLFLSRTLRRHADRNECRRQAVDGFHQCQHRARIGDASHRCARHFVLRHPVFGSHLQRSRIVRPHQSGRRRPGCQLHLELRRRRTGNWSNPCPHLHIRRKFQCYVDGSERDDGSHRLGHHHRCDRGRNRTRRSAYRCGRRPVHRRGWGRGQLQRLRLDRSEQSAAYVSLVLRRRQ